MASRRTRSRDAATQALGLLVRREHSRLELKRKLDSRGHAPDEVEATLDRLQASGLQSDVRFAEVLVRSRIAQGHGPLRIAAELRQHGLGGAQVERALAAAEPDWPVLARDLCRRRFRGPATGHAERLRRARFLAGRGFPPAVIRDCLDLDPGGEDLPDGSEDEP